jgi:hypothetical protein
VHLATTLTQVTLPTTVADTEGFGLGLIGFLVHQLSSKNPELSCNLPLLYKQKRLQFCNWAQLQKQV